MGQLEAENKRLKERLERIKDWVWAEFKVTIPKYIWLGDEEEEFLDDLIDPLACLENSGPAIKEEPTDYLNVTTNVTTNVTPTPSVIANQLTRISNQIVKQNWPLQRPLRPVLRLPHPTPQQGFSRPRTIIVRIRSPLNQLRPPQGPLRHPTTGVQLRPIQITRTPFPPNIAKPTQPEEPPAQINPLGYCFECQHQFNSKNSLKSHNLHHHQSVEKVPCTFPGCTSMIKSYNLRQHIRERHMKHRFKCTHVGCNRTFPYKYELKMHIKLKHLKMGRPIKTIKCGFPGCKKGFLNEFTCKMHYKKVHITVTEPRINVPCPTCFKVFVNEYAYQRHIRYSHRTDPPKFICTYEGCGKAYYRKSLLNQHNNLIHNEEGKKRYAASKLPCPQCGIMIGRPRLERHIETVHAKAEDRQKFICEHCGKGFPLLIMMKQHYAVHLNPNGPDYSEEFAKNCPEDIRKFIEKGKAARQRYMQRKKLENSAKN